MRNLLTILAVVVLFGLSFTLSSCKDCGKKETEPVNRGGDTNNTPLDTKTTNGTPDGSSKISPSNGTPGGNSKTISGDGSKTISGDK
jgi:hypothetical protein